MGFVNQPNGHRLRNSPTKQASSLYSSHDSFKLDWSACFRLPCRPRRVGGEWLLAERDVSQKMENRRFGLFYHVLIPFLVLKSEQNSSDKILLAF